MAIKKYKTLSGNSLEVIQLKGNDEHSIVAVQAFTEGLARPKSGSGMVLEIQGNKNFIELNDYVLKFKDGRLRVLKQDLLEDFILSED